MANDRLRVIPVSSGITCALIASMAGTYASPPARGSGGAVQRVTGALAGALPRQSRRRDTNAGCSNVGAGSFLGANAQQNIAGGQDSAVLGGSSNEACDASSSIGGGFFNIIGNGSDAAEDSFVGAGSVNLISGSADSIAGGYYNTVTGSGSFIGAGDYTYSNASNRSGSGSIVSGNDAFLGAGDQNTVSGDNAFVGAGNLNAANAYESFVGAGNGNSVNGAAAYSAIAGGYANAIASDFAFIGSGSGSRNSAEQYAFVGSGVNNVASGMGASIVGGGAAYGGSTASATDSFVGAGDTNTVSGNESFIGGGYKNTVSATSAAIVGGYANSIGSSGAFSVVAGGNANGVTNEYGVVGGGYDNVASGADAVIPGGQRNEAQGELSYAAGYQAHALYTGSFVWSDYHSGSSALADTAADQFVVRASGGTYVYSSENDMTGVKLAAGSGTWSSLSDRNAKTAVLPLDDASILAKVAALPVSAWQYKTERGVRHVGPMAQDFYAAFRVGEDDRHITSIDEDGVALAAIKALDVAVVRLRAEDRRKDAEIEREHEENVRLEVRLATLAGKVDTLTSATSGR